MGMDGNNSPISGSSMEVASFKNTVSENPIELK
jgi:hypothetical protein